MERQRHRRQSRAARFSANPNLHRKIRQEEPRQLRRRQRQSRRRCGYLRRSRGPLFQQPPPQRQHPSDSRPRRKEHQSPSRRRGACPSGPVALDRRTGKSNCTPSTQPRTLNPIRVQTLHTKSHPLTLSSPTEN